MVKTAEEYSRVTAEVSPNVTVLYITEDNIVVCVICCIVWFLMAAKPCQAPREYVKWRW